MEGIRSPETGIQMVVSLHDGVAIKPGSSVRAVSYLHHQAISLASYNCSTCNSFQQSSQTNIKMPALNKCRFWQSPILYLSGCANHL